MAKRVGIVGAGTSGLLACKYVLQKGFHPVVFEADTVIGGAWARTLEITRLQSSRYTYQFSDFPWPEEVRDEHPTHDDVMSYLHSYAHHFDLMRHILFDSRVLRVDYVGPSSEEEMSSWELWGGNGEAFGSGRWDVTVEHGRRQRPSSPPDLQVYEVDFLVLCVGRFTGVPNFPTFPPDKGPEVFAGKAIHSMDYTNMNGDEAAKLVKGKRVAVVGSLKSALDIAAECSNANGPENPCTLIYRTSRWLLSSSNILGISIGFLYFNRLAELRLRRPGNDGLLNFLLASLFSPLSWLISKVVESYLLWSTPARKYGMVPEQSFFQGLASCKIAVLPEAFYQRMEEGSLVTRKSRNLSFCKSGLVLDDGEIVEVDLVIFATGFQGEKKIRDIFSSNKYRKIATGSPDVIVPLYRACIHPRIPQLAVIGYSESYNNIQTSEMSCKWLAAFLGKGFRLPSIREMEADLTEWDKFFKRYGGAEFRKSSLGTGHVWYCDQICRDMGQDPRRKKGFFSDWLIPYLPSDYKDLVP